jgi:hypothetical protein
MSEEPEERDVLGHLETAARALIAAARDALDVADEALSDQIRLLGVFLASRPKPGDPGEGEAGPPKVERIDVEGAP